VQVIDHHHDGRRLLLGRADTGQQRGAESQAVPARRCWPRRRPPGQQLPGHPALQRGLHRVPARPHYGRIRGEPHRLAQQRGLADAGLALDHHDPGTAGSCRRQ
jgi:hypothetical protein